MQFQRENSNVSIVILSLLIFKNTILYSQNKETYNGIPIVNYCNLPEFKDRQVYLKCKWTGVEEYWSLRPVEKCKIDLKLHLDFEDKHNNSREVDSAFNVVLNNYWSSYLYIEAIGQYKTGRDGGYGHLGTNSSQFLVNKIIVVKVMYKND